MTYELGNEGGAGDGWWYEKNGKSVRNRRTDKDIARKVATSGSGATLFPDPEVATFRALSVAVPRLPTFSLFLSYHYLTTAPSPTPSPTISHNFQMK